MKASEALERKLARLLSEPDNHEIYNDIGVILYALEDFENSRVYLQKAYELEPEDPYIMYNYASVLYSVFEWRQAAQILSKYLEQRPEDKEAAEKAADAWYMAGEYGFAAAYGNLAAKRGSLNA
jgi:Flp pilus assembly protein TadD